MKATEPFYQRSARAPARPAVGNFSAACVLGGLLSYGAAVAAQQDDVRPRSARNTVTITRTELAPTIDGRVDDPAWQQATVIDDLRQIQPNPAAQPSEATEFRILYDDENLYVAARLWDSEPQRIVRHQLLQDAIVFGDDHLELFLDPRDTGRNGYIFFINPNGVQRDGLVTGTWGRSGFNMDWDGIWQAEASVDDKGWTAEFAIPFSTLDFDPDQPNWGLNIVRWLGRKREFIGWTYRDRNPTIDSLGQVRGFQGLTQGIGLDVIPSLVLSDNKDFVAKKKDSTLEPSLDVFYRITPSLTTALTLNTDFSAAEVDDRQVNLTRFSLFFPEKRDFFLQNADIFEFGNLSGNGRPFFSRTIGLSPAGQPVDLTGGLKLAGRLGRWNIGMLGVHQEALAAVDADTLFVSRISANVLEQSTLGLIATAGDPASNLDNAVLGVDFNYKNSTAFQGRSLEGEAWYQVSDTPGLDDEDAAYGASLAWPNDALDARLAFSEIQANFNPAMGFVNRAGIRTYEGHVQRRWRFDEGRLRFVLARVGMLYVTDTQDRLLTRSLELTPVSIENQPGDSVSLAAIQRREVLVDPFVIVNDITIPAGNYDYERYRATFATASYRPLAMDLVLEGGDFFDGRRF